MPTIETKYLNELRTEATHTASGKTLITDAPIDNKGKGEAFSPTDLLAASLGSCMLSIVGIVADNHGFSIEGATLKITKVMAANPRRVAEIEVIFDFPLSSFSESQVRIIKHAALTCPVALSLHPDIIQKVIFNFK
ncbi:MAG: OsmC family protein [Bacteroidetes bacterium]|nr:OsmC family protein [Bacteroidota bacterium]